LNDQLAIGIAIGIVIGAAVIGWAVLKLLGGNQDQAVIVTIVYDVDPDLGPDPNDPHAQSRRIGEVIGDGADCFVVWRQWGDEYEGGFRDRVVGQGVWENLTEEQVDAAIAVIVGEAEIRRE